MSEEPLLVATDARGVATVTLNRPALRNAFDDAVINELAAVLGRLAADDAVRVVVLTGAGKAFSAGADLAWMRRMAEYGSDENFADAMRLARMLRQLNELPKATVARVNGPAYAGGLGLVACCDVAVAAETAVFCVSEARLGLVPGTISPYVVAAIGPRAARRYFLSAETFTAAEAQRLGLVHAVAPADGLDAAVEAIVTALLAGGVGAQGHSKRLVADVAGRPVTDGLLQLTAQAIADARASAEAREGLAAFFAKRKPSWHA
jgi:methylglutaconyl-CoA hydratase